MRRTRLYRVSAVVLRQRDLAEADRILTLYTQQRGKLSAVAKGIRRPRSRLAASLQPFTHASVQLAAGRSLEVATQARAVDAYYHLRRDVARYAHACYVVELLDALVDEGLPDEVLFPLIVDTLRALNEGGDPVTLTRAFEVKLLGRLGYGPELDTCVGCGTVPRAGQAGFSVGQGGVVCGKCLASHGGQRVSAGALRALRDLRTLDVDRLAARRLSASMRAELEPLLRGFVDFRLERPLRSTAFLAAQASAEASP